MDTLIMIALCICMNMHVYMYFMSWVHTKSDLTLVPFPRLQLPSHSVRNLSLTLLNIYTPLLRISNLSNAVILPSALSSLFCFFSYCSHHCPHLYVTSLRTLSHLFSYSACWHYHSLSQDAPPSSHSPLKMLSSLCGREGGKWREWKITIYAFSLMNGFGDLPIAFPNMYASLLNEQIFPLCPLTSLLLFEHHLSLSQAVS